MTPRLLDLFCGAGGAAMGYHRAGFDVTGVDIKPQPRYPFNFIQASALEFLWEMMYAATIGVPPAYDAIHASPPCQAYSQATPDKSRHPDLLPAVRDSLQAIGLPWVIENVPGAPMRPDYQLCGCMFNLSDGEFTIRRERWFETSWQGYELRPSCYHQGKVVTILGHGPRVDTRHWADPAGKPRGGTLVHIPAARVAALAGVEWMTSREMGEAIPPAYTAHIGLALRDHLEAAA